MICQGAHGVVNPRPVVFGNDFYASVSTALKRTKNYVTLSSILENVSRELGDHRGDLRLIYRRKCDLFAHFPRLRDGSRNVHVTLYRNAHLALTHRGLGKFVQHSVGLVWSLIFFIGLEILMLGAIFQSTALGKDTEQEKGLFGSAIAAITCYQTASLCLAF